MADPARIVVCLPANVEVVLAPAEAGAGPVPDITDVQLVVPLPLIRTALLEVLAGPPGRLEVIQTLSAGVDWLVGKVPPHVGFCNARGVYEAPLAARVVGAIRAIQRGHIRSRDQQARGLGVLRGPSGWRGLARRFVGDRPADAARPGRAGQAAGWLAISAAVRPRGMRRISTM